MIVRLATHADRLPKSSQRRSCLLAEPKDTAKSLDEAISVQPLVNSRGAGLAYDFFRFLRRPRVGHGAATNNLAALRTAFVALSSASAHLAASSHPFIASAKAASSKA